VASGMQECSLKASADEVWAIMGDFGGLSTIFPDLGTMTVEGDVRMLTTPSGVIKERMVERDEAERRLTYTVIEGVPIESHSATITVIPVGSGCTVTWEWDVDPDEAGGLFDATYAGGLQELKRHFGEG